MSKVGKLLWEGGHGPLGKIRKGVQLGPLRVGCLADLLFDVVIGTPKGCEAVCFFFLPEARLGYGLGVASGRRSWDCGETRKGPQLCPLRVGCLTILLFDVLIETPESCEAVCLLFLPEARLGSGLGSLRRGGHGPLGKTRKGLNLAPVEEVCSELLSRRIAVSSCRGGLQ